MSRWPQFVFWLVVAGGLSAAAQSPPRPGGETISPGSTNPVPPTRQLHSPVDFFRQLLAMTPSERNAALTHRPAAMRATILEKIDEYEALEPDERELRLRATELRWYLVPLLRLPPPERQARLAGVPDDLRELVQSRLTVWEILPPPLQQEFLTNDLALHYFTHVETTNTSAASSDQAGLTGQFNQFFDLTPEEKQQALNTLSDAERAQMEKTLRSFDQLPPQQRLTCVRNYAKFAGMSGTERVEFLKSAESWSKMSPNERQAWRDLVQNVPQWPPLPPGMMSLPPLPIKPAIPRPNVATNLN
jgi:hypothetical protein